MLYLPESVHTTLDIITTHTMTLQQLDAPILKSESESRALSGYRARFRSLLSSDLNFQGQDSAYASHNYHAFPAKFPPQLPHKFIDALTVPGDVVLDPMMGSGTTIVESFLANRRAIGIDIDPLALRLCKTKTTPLAVDQVAVYGNKVLEHAQKELQHEDKLRQDLAARFGEAEQKFIDYWFLASTQLELVSLLRQLEQVDEPACRAFLKLVFSSIIITKSGGVSMARDLAHTRPHRIDDKVPRPALNEFKKRLAKNLGSLAELNTASSQVRLFRGNAQQLPLQNHCIDLIVTSPPYASNAIDYMRAHKFSLVWLGHSIKDLSKLRGEYIGHDAVASVSLLKLPDYAAQVISSLAKVDPKKSRTLHRYYSEMTLCLTEIARVLKPGKAAVVVVGSSNMRGIDTHTDVCLGDIGKQVGLDLVHIGVREIDRDKRMMPARRNATNLTQIEERMHEEYVIGFMARG